MGAADGHQRSTSCVSNLSNTSSGAAAAATVAAAARRPSAQHIHHPMRQTPRPYTPPISKTHTNASALDSPDGPRGESRRRQQRDEEEEGDVLAPQ